MGSLLGKRVTRSVNRLGRGIFDPMPGSYDELEKRVTALENKLAEVEQDAVVARVLADGVNRAVSGPRTEGD